MLMKARTKKERDLATISRCTSVFLWSFGALFVVFLFTGMLNLYYLLMIALFSLAGSMMYLFSSHVISEFACRLIFGNSKAKWSLRERLATELDKIKYFKRKGDFDAALRHVDDILAKDPEFPEVLFLKAQILHEEYGYSGRAKKCLEKVIQLVPEDEPFHKWASGYYENVCNKENEKKVSSD